MLNELLFFLFSCRAIKSLHSSCFLRPESPLLLIWKLQSEDLPQHPWLLHVLLLLIFIFCWSSVFMVKNMAPLYIPYFFVIFQWVFRILKPMICIDVTQWLVLLLLWFSIVPHCHFLLGSSCVNRYMLTIEIGDWEHI